MNKLKNMPVRKRLTVSFIIVTIMTSIAGLLGAILLMVTNMQYGKALEQNGFIQRVSVESDARLKRIILTDKAYIYGDKTTILDT